MLNAGDELQPTEQLSAQHRKPKCQGLGEHQTSISGFAGEEGVEICSDVALPSSSKLVANDNAPLRLVNTNRVT